MIGHLDNGAWDPEQIMASSQAVMEQAMIEGGITTHVVAGLGRPGWENEFWIASHPEV